MECNSIERSGIDGFEGRLIVNIDHHANNPDFGDEQWDYQRTNNRHSLRDSAFLASLAEEMSGADAES